MGEGKANGRSSNHQEHVSRYVLLLRHVAITCYLFLLSVAFLLYVLGFEGMLQVGIESLFCVILSEFIKLVLILQ